MDETLTWKGPADIEAGLKEKFAEFKGLVRAELGQLKGTPVLVIWQYAKGGEKKVCCLVRTGRLAQLADQQGLSRIPPGPAQGSAAQRPDALRFGVHVRRAGLHPHQGHRLHAGRRPRHPLRPARARRAAWSRPPASATASRPTAARASSSKGPCVIFESQDDACEGILGGKVKAGDVVIIRNEGPRGGPGMQEMLSPTSYIVGMGLGDKVALITDGRFSGGTAGRVHRPRLARSGRRRPDRPAAQTATACASISPTAASTSWFPRPNWPQRKQTWQPVKRELNGWLARYQKLVTNASQGGILGC